MMGRFVIALCVAAGSCGLLVQAPVLAQSSSSTTAPAPCAAPGHREFDFWIGLWSVVDAEGQFAGVNEISRVAGQCALQERWASARGSFSGTSLNWFGSDGRWHQTWIDSLGQELVLAGGLVDGRMVLEGVVPVGADDRAPPKQRIAWSREPEGRVRQKWEMSADGGRNWIVAFDGVYYPVTSGPRAVDGVLGRMTGAWIGSGEIMEIQANVQLIVRPILDGRLVELRWMNLGADSKPQLFEGVAIYGASEDGAYRAQWWDTQGSQHTVIATTDAQSLKALWGERGRTIYSLLPDGALEVVDSVKSQDGGWREFGRSRLVRQ
jgi:hypothetical protein